MELTETLKKYSIFDNSRKLMPAKNSQMSHPQKLVPVKSKFFEKRMTTKIRTCEN